MNITLHVNLHGSFNQCQQLNKIGIKGEKKVGKNE
jgi:hypothetical protein